MRRLGLSLLFVVLISIIGAGWIIDRLFGSIEQPDETIEATKHIGRQLALQLDMSPASQIQPDTLESDFIRSINLVAADDLPLPATVQEVLNSEKLLTLESEQDITLHFLLPRTERVLNIRLAKYEPLDTRLRLILTLLFYGAVVSLILLWLYPLVRRIQRLTVSAKRFGEGEFSERISTKPSSQLYGIESEFNRMAQRIQDLLADNKLLSTAVSHDLRTPLARLRFGVDALSEQITSESQQDYINRISQDLEQMEDLVEVLLEFSKLDQRLTELPLKSVDLKLILEECVHVVAHDQRIEYDIDTSTRRFVLGEDRYLKMLFNNLIDNASKFANNAIRISVSGDNESIRVLFEDDGAGFPQNSEQRLLKPFEKGAVDNIHSNKSGYGMGLAIVQRIVQWHHAELSIDSSESLGGAKVVVQFPVSLVS